MPLSKDFAVSYTRIQIQPEDPQFPSLLEHSSLDISQETYQFLEECQQSEQVKGRFWYILGRVLQKEVIVLSVLCALQTALIFYSPLVFHNMMNAFQEDNTSQFLSIVQPVLLYSFILVFQIMIDQFKNFKESQSYLKVNQIVVRSLYIILQKIDDSFLQNFGRERLAYITSYPVQIMQGIFQIDLFFSIILVGLLSIQIVIQFGYAALVALGLFFGATAILRNMISNIGKVYYEYITSNNGRVALIKSFVDSWKHYERQQLFPLFFKTMNRIREKQLEILYRRSQLQLMNRTLEDHFVAVISLCTVGAILYLTGYEKGSSLFTLLFSLGLLMNAINNYLSNYRVVRMTREPTAEFECLLEEGFRAEQERNHIQPSFPVFPKDSRIMVLHNDEHEESKALFQILYAQSKGTTLVGRNPSELSGTLEELVSLWDPNFDEERYRKALHTAEVSAFARQGILDRHQLSEGQWQRVQLAAALYADPELLLLDNVFSALDGDTAARIIPHVFATRATIVFASTRRELSAYATHFWLLKENRLLRREEISEYLNSFDRETQQAVLNAVISDPIQKTSSADTTHAAVNSVSLYSFPHLSQMDQSQTKVGHWKEDAKVLWQHFFGLWGQQRAIILLITLAIVSLSSIFSARLISQLEQEPNSHTLLMYAAITGIGIVASIARYLLSFHALIRPIHQFHSYLLTKARHHAGRSSLLARLTQDFQELEMSIPNSLAALAAGLMVTLVTFGFLIIESRFVLLLVLPCLFFLVPLARLASRMATQSEQLRMTVRAPALSFASHTLSHPVYRQDSVLNERFQKRFFFLADIHTAGSYWSQVASLRTNLLIAATSSGLLLLILWSLVAAQYTGMNIAYGTLLFVSIQFSGQINGILEQLQGAAYLRVELDRIAQAAGLPFVQTDINTEEIKELTPCQQASNIHINHVSFVSEEGHSLLQDCSLEIKPGTMTALIGESGSGKSTLLRVLWGELIPTSGQINQGSGSMILLESHFPLLDITAADFISSDASMIDERTYQLCPFDLNKPLIHYTEAERQKINIARALHRADIILLDEATSALDTVDEKEVLQLLRDSGKTILAAIHRKNHLGVFHYVYSMNKGKLSSHPLISN